METDKHATAANATVGVFFGVRSGHDVMQSRGSETMFSLGSVPVMTSLGGVLFVVCSQAI
jgi:hypothetical protein